MPPRDTEGSASDTALHAVLGKFLLIRYGEERLAVKFTALTDRADGGAKYQWYRQPDPKAKLTEPPLESGEGEVFEKYRRVGQHGDSTLVENDGGELQLRLGPVQLQWSRSLTVYFPQPWELTPDVQMALAPWERVEDIDFDSGLLKWHERAADAGQPDPKKLLSKDERDAIVAIRQRGGQVAIDPEKDGRVFIWVSLRGPGVTETDLDAVARLEHLGELAVNSSAVTDAGLKKLEGLKALEELDLSATRVTGKGLASLAGLTRLKRLEVRQTGVTDDSLVHLERLSALEYLDLSQTRVSDAGLEHLKGLTKLRVLDLGNTRLSDNGLRHIAGLRQLTGLYLGWSFARRPVTDAGLAYLKDMKELDYLELDGAGVTDEGLRQIAAAFPKLKALYISRTRVTDAGLGFLKDLRGLERLGLGDLPITDVGVEKLGGLTGLQDLFLDRTKVTDKGVAALRGLTRLQLLDLSHTQVTDESLKELSAARGLRNLHLRDTKVTDAGVRDLQGALPDITLSR